MKIKVIHNIPDGDTCNGCKLYEMSSSYDMGGSCINMYCNLFHHSDSVSGFITDIGSPHFRNHMRKCDKCRSLKDGDTIDLISE